MVSYQSPSYNSFTTWTKRRDHVFFNAKYEDNSSMRILGSLDVPESKIKLGCCMWILLGVHAQGLLGVFGNVLQGIFYLIKSIFFKKKLKI